MVTEAVPGVRRSQPALQFSCLPGHAHRHHDRQPPASPRSLPCSLTPAAAGDSQEMKTGGSWPEAKALSPL